MDAGRGVNPRHPWWLAAAATAATAVILALGATWRIRRVGVDERDAQLKRGERCIFAFWHARMLPLVFTHRRRRIAVLISRHRDGELIARVVERLGFVTARGSSTRGGEEGAREMLRLAGTGHLLAVAPDGPRGPAERAKPGLVYLASRTGMPVIPVASSAGRRWVLKSWDRFRVPSPWAKVVVAYGEPIHVPADLSEEGAEDWRRRTEAAIHDLTQEVMRLSGEQS
ncbi:MAG TPA: lysophospholipid acyltransferase family protein [Candidatus Eisenbacteria bacterium]